jgi:hypothetical protein
MSTQTQHFRFKSWDLLEAIDALVSYENGARDSGTFDLDLRQAVVSYLRGLDDDTRRGVLAQHARRFLTDDAILAGYGLRDVAAFVDWLSEWEISVS